MTPEPIPADLHRLFAAKADGTISEEEHARLTGLLKESAEVRAQWYAFQDAEEALAGWAQREGLRREEGLAVALGMDAAVRKTGRVVRSQWWGMAGAIAACLAVGFAVFALRPAAGGRDEATTSSVAVLSRGVNLEWEDPANAPAINSPLGPGTLRLKSGVAEIEFFQGARVCVEGPAELQLISAGEAFCRSGRLSAHVPNQARGFRLGTPRGEIVDLGTEFGLDLNSASPELHVFQGEVQWYQGQQNHRGQAPTRTLTTGAAASLAPEAGKPELAANPAAFVLSQDLDARVTASRQAAFERWQEAGARWNADPDLRLRLDFQTESPARSLANMATHSPNVPSASIVGCSWTEGRWPGKRALQFRSVSDRVRLNVPGEYPQMTLSAWVQVHSLNTRQNQSSLCMSQGIEVGGVHWQVLHDGSICLGIVATARPQVTDDYISPVVFTPERFGRWTHVAAVFDTAAKQVRFFVDGRRLAAFPMKRAVVPRPALAELGNWIPASDYRGAHLVRNFVGCMDDFSLVARALSDEEILRLAE